jgi:hypothetical protein
MVNKISWDRGIDELKAPTKVTRKRLDSKEFITNKLDALNLKHKSDTGVEYGSNCSGCALLSLRLYILYLSTKREQSHNVRCCSSLKATAFLKLSRLFSLVSLQYRCNSYGCFMLGRFPVVSSVVCQKMFTCRR